MHIRVILGMVIAACFQVHSSTFAQSFTEAEPNDGKGIAQPVVLTGTTGSITGTTTGSTGGLGMSGSPDVFVVQTAAAPLGMYRHRLTLTSSITGHAFTLRGLSQTAGVIGSADVAFQTSSAGSSPSRTVQWYGFGRQERVYVQITGTFSTTSPYLLSYTRSTITPAIIPDTISAGTISMFQTTATNVDLWLYDSGMNAISLAGNDTDPAFGSQARLIRDLAPGTYTMAVGLENLGNNLPSPSDDGNRNGHVLDFADAVAASAVAQPTTSLALQIDDAINPLRSAPVIFPPAGVGDVNFVRFTVTPSPDGTCCSPSGTCTMLSRHLCTGGSVWTIGGTCSPSPCTPGNNLCANALVFTVPSMTGTTANATTDPGETIPCPGFDPVAGTRGVWFRHTPATSGWYWFATPPTVPGQNHHFPVVFRDCAGTLLGCGFEILTSNGMVRTYANLTAGQEVRILVMNINNSTVGPFELVRNSGSPAGGCCFPSSFCGVMPSTTCSSLSGVYQGSGTTCVPNFCPAGTGACCRGSTCLVEAIAACTGSGARYLGNSSPCNPPGNNTSPCCKADFNQSGSISVQDIFDFLAAWFANDPRADFNGVNGITVQDLFDFLAAWFAGCP